MTRITNIKKPLSLRRSGSALALGMSAAMLCVPAHAQDADEESESDEVQLETLQIRDFTADSNPYTQEGAPYKAQRSGDPRRVQPLAETPATITVLTEQQIEESGASDLRDILDNQPGITVGTGEAKDIEFTVETLKCSGDIKKQGNGLTKKVKKIKSDRK